MGSTADKLSYLSETKELLRQGINNTGAGELLTNSNTFKEYVTTLEEHPYYLECFVEGIITDCKVSLVESVGTCAFYSCSNLTSASFPNATSIGKYAFSYCSSLTSASFPNATSIGDYAFQSCTNLTSASFPNATSIGLSAFNGCTSLTSVSFPNATSIGKHVFKSCSSLTSASFPKATSIGDYAFQSCTNLTSVDIPNATSIGDNAFNSCSSLTTLYIGTDIDTVCTLSSTNAIPSNVTKIYVPVSLVDSYKSATNWSSFADKIQPYAQPVACQSLTITADNVTWNQTSTTIHYEATCTYSIEGVMQPGTMVFKGDAVSDTFEQNTSTTETVQRTISFTFLGQTATTTITQGVYVAQFISVETSGISSYGWVVATASYNVDGYDVYMSDSKDKHSSQAVMKLTCVGYSELTLYIRSYAESSYDYTIASKANVSTYPTSYSSSDTLAHTRGKQQSGTALSNYTAVNYTGLTGNDTIYIVYVKDSSASSGDDRGFVLIPQ